MKNKSNRKTINKKKKRPASPPPKTKPRDFTNYDELSGSSVGSQTRVGIGN